MFDPKWRHRSARKLVKSLMALLLVLSLASCGGDRTQTAQSPEKLNSALSAQAEKIAEVSPPIVIQELRQAIESYQPQVSILSPQADEVFEDNTVTVQFQVQDLPIFKNPDLGLGPHLHVFLDNHSYQAVYDVNEPLVLKDLDPGTHTLRAFASRPWHESFKNEGAYAQTTFHIFTKTDDNNPKANLPLLTYSRPQGSYGAEPIMLDFYLTNAPLQAIAPENPEDNLADWNIRCTINGESFIIKQWQPIYLTGFKPGKNWVELELLDKQGNPIENVFNNTARLITYEPNGQDALSKIVRGDITSQEARGIVDRNYIAKPVEPSVTPTPEPTATPTPEAITAPEPTKEETAPTKNTQIEVKEPEAEETPQPAGFYNRVRTSPTTTETKESNASPSIFSRFLNLFGGSDAQKVEPSPTPSVKTETPNLEPVTPVAPTPQPEVTLTPEAEKIETPTQEKQAKTDTSLPAILPEAVETANPELVPPVGAAPIPETKEQQTAIQKTPTGVEVAPSPSPALPKAIETPTPQPSLSESKTQVKETPTQQPTTSTSSSPAVQVAPSPLPPTLPEIVEKSTPESIKEEIIAPTPTVQPTESPAVVKPSSPPTSEDSSEAAEPSQTPAPKKAVDVVSEV